MQLINDLSQWQQIRRSIDTSIGFAPTMGNLHAGHLSLFNQAKKDNAVVVTSLFINPTQFNHSNDFEQYPRTLEADIEKMKLAGVDYCLLPSRDAIYPDNYDYQVHETHLSHTMEGEHRPGHFNGMLTIVLKLLNLVKADNAYFGEKDFQQLQLIKGMVKAFFIHTNIIACPTKREPSGLAMSSRNHRLTEKQKHTAAQFARIFHQKNSCEQIINALNKLDVSIDYINEQQGRRFAAVTIGEVRLIDNYAVNNPPTYPKKP